MKKNISVTIRLFLSVSLLGLLFWILRQEIAEIPAMIKAAELPFILAALALSFLNVSSLALRLKLVFSGENISLPFLEALQLSLVGYFFNNFMPSGVGGDVIKAHYISRSSNKNIESYTSVMMDRIIGLYTHLCIGSIAVFFIDKEFMRLPVKPLILSLALIGILFFFSVINKRVIDVIQKILLKIKLFKVGEKLKEVVGIVHDYRNRSKTLYKSFSVSFIAQVFYFFAVYVLLLSIGQEFYIRNLFLIMPIVVLVSLMPSIGGLGFREGTMVFFLVPFIGSQTALAVSLLFLACYHIFISVLGGGVYLYWNIRHLPPVEAIEVLKKSKTERSGDEDVS